MKIEIERVSVLTTSGVDIVDIHTSLPCPFVPQFMPSQPALTIEFRATKGTGVDYVRRVFGIEPEVQDIT